MASRKEPIAKQDPNRIFQRPLEDVMHTSMMPYAEYVILERALPRVEDGLKPVQRRILYTMMEMGVTPDKPHRKSARIVGDAMGKYHPHGDTSVYDAMVRMAQDFNMSMPLVDGHGNFGSVDGDSAAAMRYTEARMAPAALEMLRDLDKDTVNFSLNFDDTLKEPDTLPARFPNLLVNGASGIAVGLATNIPPHNFRETVEGIIALLKNPNMALSEMMEYIKGPDFPTGGYCTCGEELIQAYETGRGKLSLRAKTEVERDKNGKSRIVITELPYQVNKAAMLEKILKLSEERKGILSAISDIRDESDRNGMRAVIELKRDADSQKILNYLYKYSDLEVTFGVNMVAIANGKPCLMGLMDICRHYIEYQKQVVTRRTRYELEEAQKKEHILKGLMVAVDNIDRVIRIIRSSKNASEARTGLMKEFDLTGIQAQAILDMRLRRLTALDMQELKEQYRRVVELIKKLSAILKSETKLKHVIIQELQEIENKFDTPRRTVLTSFEKVDASEFVVRKEAEPTRIVMTQKGFLKRINQKNGAKNAEGDISDISITLDCQTTDKLRIFTNLGNVFALEAEEIQECRLKDRGQNITGILAGLAEEERAVSILVWNEPQRDVIFYTKKGMVKRTAQQEYDGKRTKLAACGLGNGDEVIRVDEVKEQQDILLFTRNGMSIRFTEDSVPRQGRTAKGVKAITLEKGDEILSAQQTTGEEEFLIVSDRGYAKRVPASEFERQGRNGKGVKAMPFQRNGANGQGMVCVMPVALQDCIEMLQKNGEITRVHVQEIPLETKQGKGIPFTMALFDDVVVSVRLTSPEI